MRAIRARGGWIAVALTLAPGCGKPHAPVTQTMADCGQVMEIIEVEGRLYGWTKMLLDPEARIQACAFDVDPRGERLRVDRHEGPGSFDDMVVERDGTQTFAMGLPVEPLLVRLFRRDADGMRELDELRADWLAPSPRGAFDLLPTARGPALVALAHEWPPQESFVSEDRRAGSSAWALRAWQPLGTTADPVDLALPVNARLVQDAGTIVAVAVEYEGRAGPDLWRDSGSAFTVSVLDELAEGDDAVRWTRRVITWNDSGRGSRLVDVASSGGRVFVLAWEVATDARWLACLAADDGELLWIAPVELGELDPRGAVVGMRAKNDGVVVAAFGLGTKRWTLVTAEVTAAGGQSILAKRELDVPQVSVVEPAADGGVWLAGSENDDAWVTWVGL